MTRAGLADGPDTRRARSRRRRARRRLVAGMIFAAGIFSITATTGVSWALWSDSFTNPSLNVATGAKVGISLARVGSTATAATGSGDILTVSLTRADGQALLASTGKSVAIPIVVRVRADGNAGVTYGFALPTQVTGTLFAASTVRLFPITATSDATAQSACTPAAAPASQPSTTGIVGITTGIDPAAPSGVAAQYWCLTAVYTGAGGTYSNTGIAQGTSPAGATITAQGSWQAYMISPATYSLSHQIRFPGSP